MAAFLAASKYCEKEQPIQQEARPQTQIARIKRVGCSGVGGSGPDPARRRADAGEPVVRPLARQHEVALPRFARR